MGEAGRLDALERAVEGSLAHGALDFDREDGVLRVDGTPILATGWMLGSGACGGLALLAGAVLSLAGLDDAARCAFVPGLGLVAFALAVVLLLRFAPPPSLELRFAEREVRYRRTRVPFAELRPEHLAWRNGRFFRRLYLRHPAVRRQLAGFFRSEERQAADFQRRLWDLLSAPDGPAALGGPLTPVQRWIVGAAAPYGAVNGFRLDRLGASPGAEAGAADRRTAHELLQDPWGAYDLEQLLAAANWLVQDGHRADFAHDSELAARPAAEQEEYAGLLREVDGLIAADLLEPPFVERLIELVRVRYGARGAAYARLVPSLLRDEPGADASDEGAELAQFLGRLFNDRDHAAEELHRLEALADPDLRANVGRLMIWDYGRALMLYRWGFMVGWLTEEYCWDRMLPLAVDIQRRYSSWRDMADCYLQGRLLWSGGAGRSQAEYEQLVTRLAEDPQSPWNLVPWPLNLRRDWP
ncbi:MULTISPECIES: DUF1266 domain-containing protein [Actinomadura]|uniref:DUF1266 domain-containing protein n=1 Tax=Actinomadura yumaensis TaxID=111807 RepID=A0ABW2CHX3_9ACTN|nr:DUF1266 domain-containing protein [Actinomadura sp. J1-007]MWK34491.1 DUF1266 domain-containing protein [Actinomadura sp. J1-007]